MDEKAIREAATKAIREVIDVSREEIRGELDKFLFGESGVNFERFVDHVDPLHDPAVGLSNEEAHPARQNRYVFWAKVLRDLLVFRRFGAATFVPPVIHRVTKTGLCAGAGVSNQGSVAKTLDFHKEYGELRADYTFDEDLLRRSAGSRAIQMLAYRLPQVPGICSLYSALDDIVFSPKLKGCEGAAAAKKVHQKFNALNKDVKAAVHALIKTAIPGVTDIDLDGLPEAAGLGELSHEALEKMLMNEDEGKIRDEAYHAELFDSFDVFDGKDGGKRGKTSGGAASGGKRGRKQKDNDSGAAGGAGDTDDYARLPSTILGDEGTEEAVVHAEYFG